METKLDASPVTIADKQAETVMRDLLARLVPEHGVFGEEHGLKFGSGAGSAYMWVLDPIDGTKSFITGGRWGLGFWGFRVLGFLGVFRVLGFLGFWGG